MEVREARETGLFSCRIDFGEFFGVEKEAEWVKLREASAGELAKMAVGDGAKASEQFMAMLPALVLESSFTVDAKPASAEAAADIIKSKGTLFTYVITEWQAALPLAKRKSTKSEK